MDTGQQDNSTSRIGPLCTLSGELRFKDTLVVDGQFHGRIDGGKHLIINIGGRVEGNIAAQHIDIYGSLAGDVEEANRLDIHSGANVDGNIVTASIRIEEGAHCVGDCSIVANQAKSDKVATKSVAG